MGNHVLQGPPTCIVKGVPTDASNLPTLMTKVASHPVLVVETISSELKFDGIVPIVSVGSGSGEFEYLLASMMLLGETHDDIKRDPPIICIDPKPESFRPFPDNERYIAPKYPTVKDALLERDLKGCVLLLIWPTPIQFHDQESDSLPYDLEAILLLQPREVYIYYCATGSAGSEMLHNWLDPNIAPCDNECRTKSNLPMLGVAPKPDCEWRVTSLESRTCVESLNLPKYANSEVLLSMQRGSGYTAAHRVLLRLY